MTDTPDTPLTPCVQICVIHPDAKICTGCLRTADEIAIWGQLTNEQRREIMDRLPERAGALKKRRGGRAGRLARR